MTDFTSWIQCLRSDQLKARAVFPVIFTKLETLGFTLLNHNAIEGGYRLEFRGGAANDAYVIVDRYMVFPAQGERPGISIYCDSRVFECTFSDNAPLDIITKALAVLASNEDD